MERCACVRGALDPNLAGVLLDNAVGHGQPQTRPAPLSFMRSGLWW